VERVGWLVSLLGAHAFHPSSVSSCEGSESSSHWTCRLSVPTPTQFTFHALCNAVAAASWATAGVARDLVEHGSNDIADGRYAKRAGRIIELAAEALDGAFLHLEFRTWGGRVSVGRVSSVSGWCSRILSRADRGKRGGGYAGSSRGRVRAHSYPSYLPRRPPHDVARRRCGGLLMRLVSRYCLIMP
jgi:hypothetical protein